VQEPTPTKTCRDCGRTLPVTDFYQHHTTRDGRNTYCKACTKNRSQMNKGIKNPLGRRRFPLAPAGWKFCTDCHYLLPLAEYHSDTKSRDGHTYRCKECAKAAAIRSYEGDREGRLERGRAYYEANREHLIARQANYARRFPQKYSLIKRSWQARQRAADGLDFTLRDILRAYKSQRGRCFYCRVPLRKVFELDHVVPISKGGGNEPGNVVCACPWCNENKRDLDADEFMRLHFRTT